MLATRYSRSDVVKSMARIFFASAVASALCVSSNADTFSYDDSGWLTGGAQSNGLVTSYGYDAEGNVTSALFSSTDMAPGGGAGNGMADCWENFFFDSTGIDPLESGDDGVPYLMKFALGIDPSLGDGDKLAGSQNYSAILCLKSCVRLTYEISCHLVNRQKHYVLKNHEVRQ